MENSNSLSSFEDAVDTFKLCILGLPEGLFLTPIALGGWSPRDVIAHLIGWNEEFINVCMGIQRGQTPAYYADAQNDYSHINAGFVTKYNSQEKDRLLRQLAATKTDLVNYLSALPPDEWDADHGVVHERGGSETIRRIILALAEDYRHHMEEILAWKSLQMG